MDYSIFKKVALSSFAVFHLINIGHFHFRVSLVLCFQISEKIWLMITTVQGL